jgi:hypothetical protein
MAVNPSPLGPKPQIMLATGLPANGYKLFFYAAGSSTKQNTYTDSTGNTANSNPIVLNSLGQPATEIWFTAGESYKVVLAPSTDTDPPASPVWTIDNLEGINDATVSIDQWVTSGVTPTYVSGTQFTVQGDQTTAFHVGRRIKATVTAGTVYGYISASAYTSLTTVTVVLDSGSLDSGLSAVQLGLLTRINPSQPNLTDAIFRVLGSSDPTKQVALEVDNLTTATTRTLTLQDKSGTLPISADINDSLNYSLSATVGSNALTIALKTKAGNDPSAGDPVFIPFRSATAGTGDYSVLTVTAATSLTISSGSTLGTTSAVASRLWIVGFNDGGTFRLGAINITSTASIGDDVIASSTAEGGAGAADSANTFYTGTAVTSKAMKVLGYVESTQATAGTWATTPSKVQLASHIYETVPPSSSSRLIRVGPTNINSGTTLDITNVPSWVTRIKGSIVAGSTNGTSALLLQLGDSGGIENTNYNGAITGPTLFTSGFRLSQALVAAGTYTVTFELLLVDSATNTWSLDAKSDLCHA